jgi:uncharacterized protein involved in response to NO
MLFGFVGAAVAGFLLTAVPSWTGTAPVTGARLAALAALWVGGRVASLPPFASSLLAVAADLAFFPALGALLALPLAKAGKLRNAVFLVLLAALAAANLMIRLEWLGASVETARPGLLLAVGIVLLMVTVIGGRIIPAFTQNALRLDPPIAPRPALDRLTILVTALMIPADLVLPESAWAAAAAGIAAILHAVRLFGWRTKATLGQPLLWVLHLGYAWIPVALAMKAAQWPGIAWGADWLHALTVGAFATMIMAVMSRAALGHTGRALTAPRPMVAAYLLLLSQASCAALPG